jgi:hypothetical protein
VWDPVHVELVNGYCLGNKGEMPVTPTRWSSFAELVWILRDHSSYNVTQAMASLGKMEIKQESKECITYSLLKHKWKRRQGKAES